MRKIVVWSMSTVAALGILFGYSTSTGHTKDSIIATAATTAASGGDSAASGSGTGSGSGSGTGSGSTGIGGSTGSGSGAGSGSSSRAQSYTGDAVMTQYGPVQVQITVHNGRVAAARVTQVPWSNGRDQAINSQAVPLLNQAAVQAQSAQIDMVSGATYTSEGYIGSLQSALDKAHL